MFYGEVAESENPKVKTGCTKIAICSKMATISSGQIIHSPNGPQKFKVLARAAHHHPCPSSLASKALGLRLPRWIWERTLQPCHRLTLSWVTLHFLSISKPETGWWRQLQQEYVQDTYYSTLLSKPHVIQHDGVFFSHGNVLLNLTSLLIPLILSECHSSPTGGFSDSRKPFRACAVILDGLVCDVLSWNLYVIVTFINGISQTACHQ